MIKRAAIVGRLFYHTCQCILAQTHPLEPDKASQEMRDMQLHHAHQVCGIVAHTDDRGVDSVAIRCLPIAAAVLADAQEQAEILTILERINSQSGWRHAMIELDLKKAWGWGWSNFPLALSRRLSNNPPTNFAMQSMGPPLPPSILPARPITPLTPFTTRISTPPVIAPVPLKAPFNPLSFADFSLPNHPYQNWYEPPNRNGSFNQRLL